MKNTPFNVLRHTNQFERAPRGPFVGAAAAFLFPGAIAAGGAAALLATAATFVGITAITSWALSALAPKPNFSGTQGTLTNFRAPSAYYDIVYGEVRKGGPITFMESSGDDNTYLHMVIVLAGHEVDSIGDIYVNDKRVTLNGSGFVTSHGYNSKIRVAKHLGTDNQDADFDLISATSPDVNFRGRGLAYIYVRLEWDKDVFASGIPNFTAVVRGKKVFTGSITEWSDNAAWCIRDYITSDYGLNDPNVNATSFSVAASVCNENVSLAGGGTEKRYTINGVLSCGDTPQDNLEKMLTACAGTLFWGQGEWQLKPGYYTSPVKTFTQDDLRGPVEITSRVSRRDNFNKVSGTFISSGEDWIETGYKLPDGMFDGFVAEDGGEENELNLELPLTTSRRTAQRIAKLTLYRNREQISLVTDFGLEAVEIQPGDNIYLTLDRYGWTNKVFEVQSWNMYLTDDLDIRFKVGLKETSSAAFSWSSEEEDLIENNSNLPDPFAGLTISSVTATEISDIRKDGRTLNRFRVTWPEAVSKFVDKYIVEWKLTTDTEWNSRFVRRNRAIISGVEEGVTYNVRVSAVTVSGIQGAVTNTSVAMSGDNGAPGVPTPGSAFGSRFAISITWTDPTDTDLKHIEIWRNTVNSTSGGTRIARVGGGSRYTDTELASGTTYYYYFRAVDFSGNFSAFSSIISGTTRRFQTNDLDDNSVTADKILDGAINTAKFAAGLTVPSVVSSLPTTGNFEGRLVYLTTDDKLYRYTGSAWTKAIGTDDLTGQITETQITNGAISTPKLATNSVTSDKILANAVTAGKIQAGAVGTDQLAAGSAVISKLAITDFTNLVPNPGFNQGSDNLDGWGVGNGTATSIGTTFAGWQTKRFARIVGVGNQFTTLQSKFFQVESGQELYVSCNARVFVGSGTVGIQIRFYSDEVGSDEVIAGTTTTSSVTVTNLSNSYVVPSGANFCRVLLVNGDNGTLEGDFGLPSVRLKNNGNLIVDGVITTAKLASGAITTDKLDANSITTAKITADAITTAKINGLAVETGKIANGAVSDSNYSYTAGNVNIAELSYTVVQTLTVTTTGGPVLLLASFDYNYSAGNGLISCKFTRNGSDITTLPKADGDWIIDPFDATNIPLAGQIIDIPSAGTYTYRILAYNTIGTRNLSKRILSAITLYK